MSRPEPSWPPGCIHRGRWSFNKGCHTFAACESACPGGTWGNGGSPGRQPPNSASLQLLLENGRASFVGNDHALKVTKCVGPVGWKLNLPDNIFPLVVERVSFCRD